VTPLYTRSFVSLLLAQSAFGYAFASFFLLPKFVTTELGRGPEQIGLVMAAFGATAVIGIPLVGSLVDRLGRRRFMTAGALLMAATSLGFLWVEEVDALIFALRGLQGIAFAMTFIASATLVTDQAPPERLGQALGIFGVSMLSMHAVAPAVVEELATRFDWDAVFVSACAASLACALLTGFVREPAARPLADDTVTSLWEILRRPRSVRIAAVTGLSGAAFGAMMTYSQPFALEQGRTHVRGFFVSYAIAAVTVRVLFGGAADRVGRDRVSVVSLAGYAVVVLAMAGLRPWMLEPLGVLYGLTHGLFYPAFNALAIEGAGVHERGKVMAIFNGAFNVGSSGATLALGFLAASMGYPPVFLAAGAGVVLAWLVLVRSPEGRHWRRRGAASDAYAEGKTARVS
jgi:MFS family permease